MANARQFLAARSAWGIAQGKEEFTARDYNQDGLVLLIDGKENGGFGIHNNTLTSWKNLSSYGSFSDVRLSGEYSIGDNFIKFNDSAINSRTGTGIGRCDVSESINEKTVEVCFSGLKLNWLSDSNRKNAFFTASNTFGVLYITMGNWGSKRKLMFGLWTSNGVDSVFGGLPSGYDINPPIEDLIRFSYNNGERRFVRDEVLTMCDINTSTTRFSGTLELFNRSTDWSRPFNGKMHCMRVYNRQLSAEEMIANQKIDKARFGLP